MLSFHLKRQILLEGLIIIRDIERRSKIFSTHGLSEYYNWNHDLSYFNISSNSGLENGPHYAQDAWGLGEKLGVIASSDNHLGFAAQDNQGVTAVVTSDFSRDGVFEAIKKRHTYGTTGRKNDS